MVLRFMHKLFAEECKSNNGHTEKAFFTKKQFFSRLAKVMTDFRRKQNDRSPATLLHVMPSRRFGNQIKNNQWRAEIVHLEVTTTPISATPAAVARSGTEGVPRVVTPNQMLEDMPYKFNNTDWTMAKKVIPLRAMAIRIMYFLKKVDQELPEGQRYNRPGKRDRRVIVNNKSPAFYKESCFQKYYQMTDTMHLTQFFFKEKQYHQFMKKSIGSGGPLLSENQEESIFETLENAVLSNESEWVLNLASSSSIWKIPAQEAASYEYHDFLELIRKKSNAKDIHTIAVSKGWFPVEYRNFLAWQFDGYKKSCIEAAREKKRKFQQMSN